MLITTHTLSCGLQLVSCHRSGPAEICGVLIDAGSRDEPVAGLAHFVEHTLFKGTLRRSAYHINARMESVGGDLNAFTTKEDTTVYTTYPRGYTRRAVELLADLLLQPSFPAAPLEREKEVVLDEMASYLDDPAEAVYDLFDELAYTGSPLAHNILGTADSVNSITPRMCREWVDTRFTPGRMVVFHAGPTSAPVFFDLCERHFRMTRRDVPLQRTAPPAVAPFSRTVSRGLHQSHTLMGSHVGGFRSEHRLPLSLLTNMLGGPAMNSILNRELRERRGLVYTVEANLSLLTDVGLFTIYYGGDHADVARSARIIGDTLRSIADGSAITERRLRGAARQYLGQTQLRLANPETLAMAAARAVLHQRPLPDVTALRTSLAALTPATIAEAAQLVNLSVLTLQ